MASQSILNVTQSNFESSVLQSTKLVVVDFWAPWCGPCKQLTPILETVASEMADKVIIAKVNVDEEPSLAEQYNVRGIPTLIFFQAGEPVSVKVGLLSADQLRTLIKELSV